jgi:hypothetical protein
MLRRRVVESGTVPLRCTEARADSVLRRLGVSPFTVGRSPSARGKTAGVTGR